MSFVGIMSAAARLPVASGENVTETEHEPPAGIGAVQLLVSEKSLGFEPEMETDWTTSDAVACVPLETVNACATLFAPTAVSGNTMEFGVTPPIGNGAIPAPLKSKVACGTLLVMTTDPVTLATEVGAKVMVITQLIEGVSVAGQLLVSVKLESPVTEMLVILTLPNPVLEMPRPKSTFLPITTWPKF